MLKPSTQYTKSGRINIAYQVFGSGSVDLVYIPGWVSNIDLMWSCPELVSFLEELGKIARVILFDKRGTGLSDRIVELSTLEERMEDITAVMDAVGSQKAILFGHSEGGSVSALFAATYPSRTIALLTFGVFGKRRYSEEYPWAPTNTERQEVYDMIDQSWGSGDMDLNSLAPSKANDPVFMDWLANYFRSGASPSAALVLTKMNTQVDIIGILPAINVPTLIMQRVNDIDVKIQEGRFIAQRIKGSKLVELDGDDHLFWVGNTREVLDEMVSFISELKPTEKNDKQLLAILYAEIEAEIHSADDELLISIDYDKVNEQLVQKYRGLLHTLEDGVCLVTFEGPSKALNCCMDFKKALKAVNLNMKASIHLGECEIVENKLVQTQPILSAKDFTRIAQKNQILVSETARNLILEAGLKFTKVCTDDFRKIGELVFSVEDIYEDPFRLADYDTLPNRKNGFLLDYVIQCIDENIENEGFGVEKLCECLNLSERQLQRKLKASTNKSPNQIIRSVRLHRAKELLLSQPEDIAQIAFQTGFSNPSYFSKCFKTEFGVTPSELVQLS